MGTKEKARDSAVAGPDEFFAERSRTQTKANAQYRYSQRTVTVLISAICGWSLVEAPFERGVSNDNSWLLALVAEKLIMIVVGAAAIANLRFCRQIFAFICGASVLAIAPGLPLKFKYSVAISLLSLIECVGKAAFVIAFCRDDARKAVAKAAERKPTEDARSD